VKRKQATSIVRAYGSFTEDAFSREKEMDVEGDGTKYGGRCRGKTLLTYRKESRNSGCTAQVSPKSKIYNAQKMRDHTPRVHGIDSSTNSDQS
jgi:hypothetical protein